MFKKILYFPPCYTSGGLCRRTSEPSGNLFSVLCPLAACGWMFKIASFLFFFAPDSDRQDEHLSVVHSNTGQVSYYDF